MYFVCEYIVLWNCMDYNGFNRWIIMISVWLCWTSTVRNSWEKWLFFMLCLNLWLRQKGQIIPLVFTWIEQVSSVLDHYLWWKIWIPWSPFLIVQICGNMYKMQRKWRDNNFGYGLDNCVCFREPIIVSDKNNENVIFIINSQPPEVYTKSCKSLFLLKYSSTWMTFYKKVAKIRIVH